MEATAGAIGDRSPALGLVGLPTWIGLSTAVFLTAWLLPGNWYESLVGEPNHLHLDWRTLLFNSLAIGSFVAGVAIYRAQSRRRGPAPLAPVAAGLYAVDGVLTLSLVAIHLAVVYSLFSGGGLEVFVAWLRGEIPYGRFQQGFAFDSGGLRFGATLAVTRQYLPWSFWLYLHRRRRWPRAYLFWALLATYLAAVLPLAKRNHLARPLLGILLVYALYLASRRLIRRRRLLGMLGAAAGVVMVLFVSTQAVRTRTARDSRAVARDVVRYMAGGYNVEAFLLAGNPYPGEKTGFFWTQWLWEFPVARNVLPLAEWRRELLGEPVPFNVRARMRVVRGYGLGSTTTMTAFGASYVDFGWLGFLPFVLAGAFAAYSWRRFTEARFAGVFFYPLVAYAVADWRGFLQLPPPYFGYLLVAVAAHALGSRWESEYMARRGAGADGGESRAGALRASLAAAVRRPLAGPGERRRPEPRSTDRSA